MKTESLPQSPLFRIAGLAILFLTTVALLSGCSQGYTTADRVVRAEPGELTVAKASGVDQRTYAVAPDAEVTLDGRPAAITDLDGGDAVKLATEQRDDGTKVIKKVDARSKEALNDDRPATTLPTDTPTVPDRPVPAPQVDNPTPPQDQDPQPQPLLPKSDQPIVDPEDGAPRVTSEAPRNTDANTTAAGESFFGKINSLSEDRFGIQDDKGQSHTFLVNGDTKFTLDGKAATFDVLMVDRSVSVTAVREGESYLATFVAATSNFVE